LSTSARVMSPWKVPGSYVFLGNGGGEYREASYHGMGSCELPYPKLFRP